MSVAEHCWVLLSIPECIAECIAKNIAGFIAESFTWYYWEYWLSTAECIAEYCWALGIYSLVRQHGTEGYSVLFIQNSNFSFRTQIFQSKFRFFRLNSDFTWKKSFWDFMVFSLVWSTNSTNLIWDLDIFHSWYWHIQNSDFSFKCQTFY